MTWGKKTGGKDFAPGWEGGPGRPKLPQEVRDFRNATKVEIIEEFKMLWAMSEEELNHIVFDGGTTENKTPAVRKFMAKAILKAINTGDMDHIDKILNRVIGKVKEEIDLTSKGSLHFQIVNLINNIEKEVSHGEESSPKEIEEIKK